MPPITIRDPPNATKDDDDEVAVDDNDDDASSQPPPPPPPPTDTGTRLDLLLNAASEVSKVGCTTAMFKLLLLSDEEVEEVEERRRDQGPGGALAHWLNAPPPKPLLMAHPPTNCPPLSVSNSFSAPTVVWWASSGRLRWYTSLLFEGALGAGSGLGANAWAVLGLA
jgi:hypothetical protein